MFQRVAKQHPLPIQCCMPPDISFFFKPVLWFAVDHLLVKRGIPTLTTVGWSTSEQCTSKINNKVNLTKHVTQCLHWYICGKLTLLQKLASTLFLEVCLNVYGNCFNVYFLFCLPLFQRVSRGDNVSLSKREM